MPDHCLPRRERGIFESGPGQLEAILDCIGSAYAQRRSRCDLARAKRRSQLNSLSSRTLHGRAMSAGLRRAPEAELLDSRMHRCDVSEPVRLLCHLTSIGRYLSDLM